MKRSISVGLSILLSAGLLLMGCQTKEVTSAKVYIQQDDWDKAIEQLEQAIALYPDDPEAHYLLGQGYGKKGDFEGMTREFDASLAISETFKPKIDDMRQYYWGTNFNTGIKYHKDNNYEASLKSFQTSILIDPKRPEPYKNLAVVYLSMDSVARAAEVYEKLVEMQPNDGEALRQLAQFRRELNEYDEAIELLQKALEINSQDVDALNALALNYDLKGDSEKAFEIYKEALENAPDNTDIMFNYARLFYLRGDYDSAINWFGKILKIKPDDHECNLNVGNAYLSIGEQYRKELRAKEEKDQSITQEESDKLKSFYCNAIPYLEKCSEMQPDNANLWNNLGVAYVNCGQKEKGEEAFKKAEELK